MSGKILIEFDDTPEMRSVLTELSIHASDDEAPATEDEKPLLSRAYSQFSDVVTRALHPEAVALLAEEPCV